MEDQWANPQQLIRKLHAHSQMVNCGDFIEWAIEIFFAHDLMEIGILMNNYLQCDNGMKSERLHNRL